MGWFAGLSVDETVSAESVSVAIRGWGVCVTKTWKTTCFPSDSQQRLIDFHFDSIQKNFQVPFGFCKWTSFYLMDKCFRGWTQQSLRRFWGDDLRSAHGDMDGAAILSLNGNVCGGDWGDFWVWGLSKDWLLQKKKNHSYPVLQERNISFFEVQPLPLEPLRVGDPKDSMDGVLCWEGWSYKDVQDE